MCFQAMPVTPDNPTGITRDTQFVLAGVAVVASGAIRGWLLHRWRHGRKPDAWHSSRSRFAAWLGPGARRPTVRQAN